MNVSVTDTASLSVTESVSLTQLSLSVMCQVKWVTRTQTTVQLGKYIWPPNVPYHLQITSYGIPNLVHNYLIAIGSGHINITESRTSPWPCAIPSTRVEMFRISVSFRSSLGVIRVSRASCNCLRFLPFLTTNTVGRFIPIIRHSNVFFNNPKRNSGATMRKL